MTTARGGGSLQRSRAALILVGALSIAVAAIGIWYNASMLLRVPPRVGSVGAPMAPPHFLTVFYTMSAISLACNVLLVACGVQYVRLRSNVNALFLGIMVFEVLYLAFAVLAARTVSGIGANVGASNGIANGGLVPQLIVLLPLWAPLVAIRASRRLRESGMAVG